MPALSNVVHGRLNYFCTTCMLNYSLLDLENRAHFASDQLVVQATQFSEGDRVTSNRAVVSPYMIMMARRCRPHANAM